MPRNVDNIYFHVLVLTGDQEEDLTIDATLDPDITMLVTCSAIAGIENSKVRLIDIASLAHEQTL